jgi:DNA polymerase III subunit delta'
MSPARTDRPAAPPPTRERILELSEILGQERVVAMLRQAIARNTLHHALLFAGPEGIGKRTTALALAAHLLCRARGNDACGACAACFQVAAGTHPDLHRESFAEDDKKQKRSSMVIEQVRGINVVLGARAFAGGKKIVIFEEAQALTEEAQNAFLKTLEEPPGDALIILVAHNASALRPTVRSRCQRVAFSPLSQASVETILRERLDRSADDARMLAAFSEGSLMFVAEADRLRDAHERVSRLLARGASGSYHEAVTAAKEVLGSQKGIPLDLKLVVASLRSQLRARAGIRDSPQLTPPTKTGTLLAALRALEAAYGAVVDLGRNANRSLAAERMWLSIGENLE